MAARQHYSFSNAGPVNNTSNASWAALATLPDFEPDASSTYAIFWSGAFQNATNTSADAQIRVRFGPAGFETSVATLNIESAATSDYPQLAGMFFHVEDVAPVDVYADLSFKAETNGNSINGKNGQIVALKLGANDATGESLSRQTSTTTTNVSAATANFTSDGGDYVVVGYGEFDCSVTSAPVYVRLTCNGTNTGELGVRGGDLTNLSPGMMAWRFTSVPSGARSASFQFHAHSSTTAGCTNARVLVMRAADFDAIYSGQLSSDSAGTQSSYTSAITVTETVTANPHLLLGGWGTSSTTSGTDVRSQVTQGGAQIAESIRRAYNAAQIRFNISAFASVRSGHSAGSLTWTLDRGQSGSNTIAIGAGSALVLMDLGASGGAVSVTPANSAHINAASSPTLAAKSTVSPNNAANVHTASSPSLAAKSSIAPDSASHTHTATSPNISTANSVTVDSAAHLTTASQASIAAASSVEPDDAAHILASTSPTLSAASAVSPDGSAHTTVSTSPSLAAVYPIAPDSAAHLVTSTQSTITLAGAIAPDDAVQNTAATSPTLAARSLVLVDSAAHETEASEPNLSGTATIAVASTFHGNVVGSPSVAWAGSVVVSNAINDTASTEPVIGRIRLLPPPDRQAHTETSVRDAATPAATRLLMSGFEYRDAITDNGRRAA